MPIQNIWVLNTDNSKFILKSLKLEHNCGRALENKKVTSHWIVKRYLEFFRDNPIMKVNVLQAMIKRDISVYVKKMTLYRAKNIALDEIEGEHLERFGKIRDYAFAVMMTNQGSLAVVDMDHIAGDESAVVFNAIFITFPAMAKGVLKGYRLL